MIVFFLYNSTCFYGLACVSAKHVSFLVDISLGGDGGDGGDGLSCCRTHPSLRCWP